MSAVLTLTTDVDRQAVAPDGFFDRDGLKANRLAEAVRSRVIHGVGELDRRFYVWESGVWRPGDDDIHRTVTESLGDRYRRTHMTNVADILRYAGDVPVIDLEPNADWINVRNGLVCWRTRALRPHSPEVFSVTQLPHDYDPAADCPAFEGFVRDVLPEDCWTPGEDSPGFIWELLAYAVYSGNPFHLAVLLFGSGRNGKGVLLHTIEKLLGHRNISTVTLHDLTQNRFRAADLYGKLANVAGDLDSRWLDNTAVLKAITGGDAVAAEHKYGQTFSFRPWALPIYSTNKAFGSADNSEGYHARWLVIPFPNSFVGREDRGLQERVSTPTELRGVLRRAIDALPALMERGRFMEPDSVKGAKKEFVVAGDRVRGWLDEECILTPAAWTVRTDLYREFTAYAQRTGSKPMSAAEFYQRLDQIADLRQRKSNGTRGYEGLRLRDYSDRHC